MIVIPRRLPTDFSMLFPIGLDVFICLPKGDLKIRSDSVETVETTMQQLTIHKRGHP